jgi:hypothetical protein
MAPQILRMGCFIRLPACQRVRETNHEFSQSGAHPSARVAVHIAPCEEQHIYPRSRAQPVREHLSRDAANAAARRGATCGPPQRYDQSPSALRRRIPACRPWTRTHPDVASPQTSDRCVGEPPPRHCMGLGCEPMSALGAASPQNLTAVRRAHPFQEAVAALALAPVGLVCPFHGSSVNGEKVPMIWRLALVCQVLRAAWMSLLAFLQRRLATEHLGSMCSRVSRNKWIIVQGPLPYPGRVRVSAPGRPGRILPSIPGYVFYNILNLKDKQTYPHLWKSLCVTPVSLAGPSSKSAKLPVRFNIVRCRKFLTFRWHFSQHFGKIWV